MRGISFPMISKRPPGTEILRLAATVLLGSALLSSALPEGDSGKIEGTANPDPAPIVDPDKALLSTIKFPEGMVAEVFASEPDVQNPTAICFDDKNRLYIAETHRFDRGIEDNRRSLHSVREDFALKSTAERLEMYKRHTDVKPMSYFTKYAEKIRVIEDTDGDGKCDKSTIYADGFNDPLDGTAAGILALDGKVYLASIPHVWMLEDTDGDLVSDTRESLQEGYGISVSLSGHDLNGFALGPDGRIWFTIGDRAYNLKTKEGKHLYSQYEGAVFRMERDGSGLEVVHTGLRNPKEIAFDRFGNAFSVDNNADMGDKARVVDIVEGGFSGWHRGNQGFKNFRDHIDVTPRHKIPWMEEHQWEKSGENRPAAMLPPAGFVSNGPSGLAFNPGTGLAEKWDDHFFICDYRGGKSAVIAFRMAPDGAGFKVERQEDFISGFLNTDIEFGYDGKVYVTDYVGNWSTYGFGNVFTFENPVETAKPESREIKGIFAGGFDKLKPARLAELLRHPDMRVRLRAQLELAEDAANRAAFVSATATAEPVTTRLHGVWGLGNLARMKGDPASGNTLVGLCADADEKVRGQSIQALGDAGFKPALESAVALLEDDSPRVRMLAAITTGKLGGKQQVGVLMDLAKRNDDKDAYVRHAAVDGLFRIGDADAVFTYADDASPAVRRAMVLALRRFSDPRIARFLKDGERSVAVEAAQAINDTYIEGARGQLAAATHLLGKISWMIDVRILNSMLRAGGDENVSRLLTVAADPSQSVNVRTEALFLLERWENPPPVDPTTGKHRPLVGDRGLAKMTPRIRSGLVALLGNASGDLLVEALGAAGKFGVEIPPEVLLGHLANPKNQASVRSAALERLEAEQPGGFTEVLVNLTSDNNAKLRGRALQTLGRVSPEKAMEVVGKILSSGKISDQQNAIALLGTIVHPSAAGILSERLEKLGSQPPELRLDVIEAASRRGEASLKNAVTAYESSLDSTDPLGAFRPALAGGSAARGKEIIFNHGAALCTQCHKIGKTGGDAGPNLAGIGARHDAEYILESIVLPNAKLAAGYSPVAVTMKDGSIVAGMLMEETETKVVVRNPETKKDTVCKREDIATMPAPMSTMPPMGLILKKPEIRDLVAYLSGLRK